MKRLPAQKGFTLVEMLVSIALFAVVATIGVSTLLVLINVNGKAQGMQLIMTNLSFALDSMTRELRTGFDWDCRVNSSSNPDIALAGEHSDCSSGNYISVVESGSATTERSNLDDRRITYWFDPNYYGADHGAIVRSLWQETDPNYAPLALTGEDVDIDSFVIEVLGATAAGPDVVQPRATIYIAGKADSIAGGFDTVQREFNLQTTVTQRLLDI